MVIFLNPLSLSCIQPMNQKIALKVIKIGGSIISDRNEFRKVAERIRVESELCINLTVVISAMKGVTDKLIALYEDTCEDKFSLVEDILKRYPKLPGDLLDSNGIIDMTFSNIKAGNVDSVITMGERLSALCLHSLLHDLGVESIIMDPGEIICADEIVSSFSAGNDSDFVRLQRTGVWIVPGFYGRNKEGSIKAFSRGGSDLSAGVIAGSLGATELEFWKDVSAVMTGDPKIVESPKPILYINRNMLREMAELGSRILHPLSLDYVDLNVTKVRIRGIEPAGESSTEIVSNSVNCLSIVVSEPSDEKRLTRDSSGKERSGVYVLTEGEPEFVTTVSSRVRRFFEIIGSGIPGTLTQDNGLISFRSSYTECRVLANELHRDLFSGDDV